jgi:hypothetical protein
LLFQAASLLQLLHAQLLLTTLAPTLTALRLLLALVAAVLLHVKAAAVLLHVKVAAVPLVAVLLAAAPLRKLKRKQHAFQFDRWQFGLPPVVLYPRLTHLKLELRAI